MSTLIRILIKWKLTVDISGNKLVDQAQTQRKTEGQGDITRARK